MYGKRVLERECLRKYLKGEKIISGDAERLLKYSLNLYDLWLLKFKFLCALKIDIGNKFGTKTFNTSDQKYPRC